MKIDRNTHIVDLVAALRGAGGVFDAMGIDYSSPGERSIAEAAGLEGIDPDTVLLHIRRLPESGEASWLDRPLSDLMDSLVEQHDRLIEQELDRLEEALAGDLAESAALKDNVRHFREEVRTLASDFMVHVSREEELIFPLIRNLEALWQSNTKPSRPSGDVKEIIKKLLVEHGSIGARIRKLHDLRLAIEAHNDVSPLCRTALQVLADLESDLRYAMFLENCILFPRALALQESLRLPVTIGT